MSESAWECYLGSLQHLDQLWDIKAHPQEADWVERCHEDGGDGEYTVIYRADDWHIITDHSGHIWAQGTGDVPSGLEFGKEVE